MRCDLNWTRLMLLPNKPTPESSPPPGDETRGGAGVLRHPACGVSRRCDESPGRWRTTTVRPPAVQACRGDTAVAKDLSPWPEVWVGGAEAGVPLRSTRDELAVEVGRGLIGREVANGVDEPPLGQRLRREACPPSGLDRDVGAPSTATHGRGERRARARWEDREAPRYTPEACAPCPGARARPQWPRGLCLPPAPSTIGPTSAAGTESRRRAIVTRQARATERTRLVCNPDGGRPVGARRGSSRQTAAGFRTGVPYPRRSATVRTQPGPWACRVSRSVPVRPSRQAR